MTHQTYLRALARLVTTLLVATFLSALGAAAVHADDGDRGLLVTVDTPTGLTAVEGGLELYRWDESGQTFQWFEQAELVGHVSGDAVAFHVPAGHYWVSFWTSSFSYELPAVSGDATEIPTEVDDTGVVEVTDDSGLVDTRITVLPSAAVSGTVLTGDRTPLAHGEVKAYAADGHPEDGHWFAGDVVDGVFTLPVEAGSWRFVVSDLDGAYGDHSYAPVTLTRGEQRTLPDVTLPEPTAASVSGVAVVMGVPRAGVRVSLVRVAPDGSWESVASTTTDADGEYSLTGVRRNTTYTVLVDGYGIVPTYLGGATELVAAHTFTHADDPYLETIDADRATLVGGVLRGAADLTGIVSLYRSTGDGDSLSLQHVGEVTVEAGESYALPASPGRYVLLAEISDNRFHHTWFGARAALTAQEAGTFTVDGSTASLTVDVPVLEAASLTGLVVSAAGPVAGAVVTPYVWEDGHWNQYDSATTAADGAYRLSVPEGLPVTYRVSRNGFLTQFRGGGSTLPTEPTTDNSITVTGSATAGTTTLTPRPTTLGKVAGQVLDWCLAHELPAGDDATSGPVALPFPLRWNGTTYDEIHVNNDANVTFGGSPDEFDPAALTADNGMPMIAPFLTDVDTRSAHSSVVTYGASPDGTQFCATWADVAHAGQGTNLHTYQLILTAADGAGRSEGDFDIRFNYDQIPSGTAAVAGFTHGSGEPGSTVLLDGSLSLVGGSQNSIRPGRWNFSVRNGTPTATGSLQGRVTRNGTATVATVEACRSDSECAYTRTDADGRYRLTGVRVGTYDLRAWPTGDFLGRTTATVTAGETTAVSPIALLAAAPLDPVGIVTDQWGRPVAGASAELTRAEDPNTTYVRVPEDSTVLAPGRRANPVRTGTDGHVGWDVLTGSYRVTVTAPGCGTATSGTIEVPGRRVAPTLTLNCADAGPVPSTAPTLTGPGEVGTVLTATAGAWPAPLASTGVEWLRNGAVDTRITGTTYAVKETDVGTTFTVRVTARTPDRVDATTGEPVAYRSASATSVGIRATARPPVEPPVVEPPVVEPPVVEPPVVEPPVVEPPVVEPPIVEPPVVEPPVVEPPVVEPPVVEPPVVEPPPARARARITVTRPKRTVSTKRARMVVRVRTTGRAPRPVATGRIVVTMTAKGKVKGKKVRTQRVRLTKGRATFRLRKLPRGTWIIRVTYPGNAKITSVSTKKYRLKVTTPKKGKKAKKRRER